MSAKMPVFTDNISKYALHMPKIGIQKTVFPHFLASLLTTK
jgi:hypothetical protein